MIEHCTITERGTHLCPGGEEIFVRNVYPPIQELQPRVLAVVIIFTLCLVVGVCGNASVLTLIYGIMRGNQLASARLSTMPSVRRSSTDNTMLYIAALCVVDFLMSMSLPPAILDSIIGFWMFGTPICKLHHICGSVGRIVSTFLITAMSFDRWVAVCHPYKRNLRSRKFVITIIFALWTLAFLLLLPMLTYARANEILLHQLRQLDQRLGVVNITRVRVYKCSDMLPPVVFYWFTSSTFVLGYCVPLVLIVYFNSRLIRKLYRHTKQLRSGIPLRRITTYTALIAALYFICWTPYWCTVLYAIWMSAVADDGHPEATSDMLLFIIYCLCLHLLPYLGSATNWILYGLLNTQLQMRQHEATNCTAVFNQPATTANGWTNGVPSSAATHSPHHADGKRRHPCHSSRNSIAVSGTAQSVGHTAPAAFGAGAKKRRSRRSIIIGSSNSQANKACANGCRSAAASIRMNCPPTLMMANANGTDNELATAPDRCATTSNCSLSDDEDEDTEREEDEQL